MDEILRLVSKAQDSFREKLTLAKATGGLNKERYIRFLSMQYHLNKDVQKHFYKIASNLTLAKVPNLRRWLIRFAGEEEFHFDIALADLKELGSELLPMPFDIRIWWLFFDSVINERPFFRLGGTCVLENISNKSGDVLDELIQEQQFLNPKNLRYLIIHRHDPTIDHGAQVLRVLSEVNLNASEYEDIRDGVLAGTTIYLRAIHWTIFGEPIY